jgi:hypothetical protein
VEAWEQRLLKLTGLAITVALALGGFGATKESAGEDGGGWFVAAGWLGGATVFVLLMVFLIWPGLQRLPRLRKRILAGGAPRSGGRGALRIRKAIYGAQGHLNDVTTIVATQVTNDQLDMLVANTILGGDPIVDVPKALTINYSVDGKDGTKIFQEGTNAVLP